MSTTLSTSEAQAHRRRKAVWRQASSTTSYQVGSALGLAAMTALATSQGADQLGNLPALTNGFSAAFLGAGIIAAVGAVLATFTLRGARPPPTAKTRPPSRSDAANPAADAL